MRAIVEHLTECYPDGLTCRQLSELIYGPEEPDYRGEPPKVQAIRHAVKRLQRSGMVWADWETPLNRGGWRYRGRDIPVMREWGGVGTGSWEEQTQFVPQPERVIRLTRSQ